MTDWSVSRKLDEVIAQNKEIINLMKMQMVMINPNVDFYELNNKVRMAVHESQAKEQADKEEWLARRESEKQEQEKRIREEKLKEKNAEINSIINTHNQVSDKYPGICQVPVKIINIK